MTAATVTSPAAPRPLARRLTNVIRLQLANPFTIFITPALVVGLIFVGSWVLWWIIGTSTGGGRDAVEGVSIGMQFSGASLWIFVYMMVVAIQSMNFSFPFALGMGSTRRDYFLGTAVTFLGLSALFALIYLTLSAIEVATNGWGVGGAMFTTLYFGGVAEPWGLRLFYVFAAFVFFFFAGSLFGALYVRYRARGLVLFFTAFGAVVIGLAALATLTESWSTVGEFFVTVGFAGGYGLSLAISLAAGLAGYLVLRRATPRS